MTGQNASRPMPAEEVTAAASGTTPEAVAGTVPAGGSVPEAVAGVAPTSGSAAGEAVTEPEPAAGGLAAGEAVVGVVAVIGRPNVGKSTLVNRILGRREAIVQERPGVTRDRKAVTAEWLGRRFTLVDTGGWMASAAGLDGKVSDQAERAVRDADAVLFVVDAVVGLTGDDETVARLLHRAGTPVLVAANKVDSPGREGGAWEMLSLGFGDPHPISALHGRGTGDLLDALIALLPAPAPGPADDPEAPGPGETTPADDSTRSSEAPPASEAQSLGGPPEAPRPGGHSEANEAPGLGEHSEASRSDEPSRTGEVHGPGGTPRAPAAPQPDGPSRANEAPGPGGPPRAPAAPRPGGPSRADEAPGPGGPPRAPAAPRPGGELLSVAIVGRPNAGKSTLFNRLIGEDRSIVHDQPGTTRDAIDTSVATRWGPVRFVDTAGMRRRARIDTDTEYYSLVRALRAVDDSDVALLVVDASVGVTHQDQRLAERVDAAGCPVVVVLNKWDLIGTEARLKLGAEVEDKLGFLGRPLVLRVSALSGKGVGRLWPSLRTVAEAYRTRIPTRRVNEVVRAAQSAQPAPAGARILYAVQGASDPPTFTLFTNRELPRPYLRYVERRLREELDLGPTAVKLRVRRRD